MDIRFTDKLTEPKRFKVIDKIRSFMPHTHRFLDRFPEPWRSRLILFGYRLGLVQTIGYIKFEEFLKDGKTPTGKKWINCNIIPDVAVTQIRDILAGTSTNLPKNMEFGTGTTPPVAADTDLTTPLTNNDRLVCTVTSPGSFELRLEAFINSTYGPTRPYTIEEMAIFVDPEESGIIIAHALVNPPVTVTGTNTFKTTYGLLLR